MADQEPLVIRIHPDSELALVIKEAAASDASVRVDTGEEIYRLRITPDDERRANETVPSVDEVRASREGILDAAGSWKDVDTEAFKAYIRERRRTSSRPPVTL